MGGARRGNGAVMSVAVAGRADDIIDAMMHRSGGAVLRAPHGADGGEYDDWQQFTRHDIRRLVGAGLIARGGWAPDQLAMFFDGCHDMNADQFCAWWMTEGLEGLDQRAERRASTVDYADLERPDDCWAELESQSMEDDIMSGPTAERQLTAALHRATSALELFGATPQAGSSDQDRATAARLGESLIALAGEDLVAGRAAHHAVMALLWPDAPPEQCGRGEWWCTPLGRLCARWETSDGPVTSGVAARMLGVKVGTVDTMVHRGTLAKCGRSVSRAAILARLAR